MALDMLSMALSQGYTDETVIGGGALKGKNCVVSNIEEVADGVNVTFQSILDDGTVKTDTAFIPRGTQGEAGVAGKSAYEIWLEAGNTGTEEDFLISLVGEKGADGTMTFEDLTEEQKASLKGEQGIQGEKGEKGDTYAPVIGDVLTVDSTSEASATVTLDEVNKKATFNFSIPKGADGAKGEQGEKGDTGANGANGATGPQGPVPLIHVNGMGGSEKTMAELGPSEGIIAICTNVNSGSFFTSVTDGTVKCNGESFTSSKQPIAGTSYVIVNSSYTNSARIYCKNNGGSAWTIIGDVL